MIYLDTVNRSRVQSVCMLVVGCQYNRVNMKMVLCNKGASMDPR